MDVTFLVGNGFDISAGLHTSYKDFYKWYLKRPTTIETIKRFKAEIQRGMYDTWADFEVGLGQYTSNFSEHDVNNFIECYNDAYINIREFLQMQEGNFNTNTIDIDSFRNGIVDFYNDLAPLERDKIHSLLVDNNIDFNFISFNYTNILNNVCSSTAKRLHSAA